MNSKLPIYSFALFLLLFAFISEYAQAQQTCQGQTATIVGTNGDDVLIGTSGNDVIVGLDGNDTIDGLEGDDIICGGDRHDNLIGGAGNDTINSGSGIDIIDGSADTDTCINGESTSNCETVIDPESNPPTISIDQPSDPIISDTSPDIVVSYSDADSGVDINTVQISLDGNDITSTCSVGASSTTCSTSGLTEALHTVDASINDLVGNIGTDTYTFEVDIAFGDVDPPIITATKFPDPNVAGWNNTGVLIQFSCEDSQSGVATCNADLEAISEGANQTFVGTGTDNAGNSGNLNVALNIDLTYPTISVTTPENSAIVDMDMQTISGTASDGLSGLAGVTCNGTAATIIGSDFDCDVTLIQGQNTIEIIAIDLAGNTETIEHILNYLPGPQVAITSPNDLELLSSSPITVSGTVDNTAVGVTVNGVQATITNNTFSATGVALLEGSHVVTAVAIDAAGNVATSSITLVLDTTPPIIKISTPIDSTLLNQQDITVTGVVNDVVTRAATGGDVTVTVNGQTAVVSNGTFMLDLTLDQGSNLIDAIATDATGNSASDSVLVDYQPAIGQRINLLSGNNQSAEINETLQNPLVVSLTDGNGNPIAGRKVNFKITRGDGEISDILNTGRKLDITTDASGEAQVFFKLGTRSGMGYNIVKAHAIGFSGEVEFQASADPKAPAGIAASTGDNQLGAIGEPLPEPLIVFVHDEGGNPLSGIQVTFAIEEGGGSFGGNPTFVDITDNEGRAAAIVTLGNLAGNSNNVVSATIANNISTSFLASAAIPGPMANTKITGVVLDNTDLPIEGVTITIDGTPLIAVTDSQGLFTIDNAPVGPHHLVADGTTSNRSGTWPVLGYDINLIQGINNDLGMPILMLPIDTASGQMVGGSSDIQVGMSDVAGFSMEVKANSATFPGGASEGMVSVTQVHFDKLPMAPPLGIVTDIAITIQPPNVEFDPPAQVTFPNVSNLEPGQIVDIMSFDHDLSEFVVIGTATVSDDGSIISTDPGFGILKAGWHFPVPPIRLLTCFARCLPCRLPQARFNDANDLVGCNCAKDSAINNGQPCRFFPETIQVPCLDSFVNVTVDVSCSEICVDGECKQVPGNDTNPWGYEPIFTAAKDAISEACSTCIANDTIRQKVQDNLIRDGLIIVCKQDENLMNKTMRDLDTCGEASGMNLGASGGAGKQNQFTFAARSFRNPPRPNDKIGPACRMPDFQARNIFHDIIHLHGDFYDEDVPLGCETLCYGPRDYEDINNQGTYLGSGASVPFCQ